MVWNELTVDTAGVPDRHWTSSVVTSCTTTQECCICVASMHCTTNCFSKLCIQTQSATGLNVLRPSSSMAPCCPLCYSKEPVEGLTSTYAKVGQAPQHFLPSWYISSLHQLLPQLQHHKVTRDRLNTCSTNTAATDTSTTWACCCQRYSQDNTMGRPKPMVFQQQLTTLHCHAKQRISAVPKSSHMYMSKTTASHTPHRWMLRIALSTLNQGQSITPHHSSAFLQYDGGATSTPQPRGDVF